MHNEWFFSMEIKGVFIFMHVAIDILVSSGQYLAKVVDIWLIYIMSCTSGVWLILAVFLWWPIGMKALLKPTDLHGIFLRCFFFKFKMCGIFFRTFFIRSDLLLLSYFMFRVLFCFLSSETWWEGCVGKDCVE